MSGYVHEEYLVDQTVPTAVAAFVSFRDRMRVKFRVTIDYMVFDRDASFNRKFRAALLTLGVDSNMSGANDHWELGAIETYWDTWTSMVAAFTMHAGLDATYWRFASGMANYILNRTLTSSNLGYVSPIEYLTNEVPSLSHLRTLVLSPTDVALPSVVVEEVLLLICCDTMLPDKVVDTANVTLVDDNADVLEAVEDIPVDVLTDVPGLLEALITDTTELDC